jgi:hypothetical protein
MKSPLLTALRSNWRGLRGAAISSRLCSTTTVESLGAPPSHRGCAPRRIRRLFATQRRGRSPDAGRQRRRRKRNGRSCPPVHLVAPVPAAHARLLRVNAVRMDPAGCDAIWPGLTRCLLRPGRLLPLLVRDLLLLGLLRPGRAHPPAVRDLLLLGLLRPGRLLPPPVGGI